MLSAFAMDRHGKGSERDHLVPIVDEPPHAGVAFVLASELDALRDHRVLHAECARTVGADARYPIADRRIEAVGLVLLLRELRHPRRPRAVEDDPDVVLPLEDPLLASAALTPARPAGRAAPCSAHVVTRCGLRQRTAAPAAAITIPPTWNASTCGKAV